MTRLELDCMSQAMIGLLNHAQAAELLGVCVKRVGELACQGKLRRLISLREHMFPTPKL